MNLEKVLKTFLYIGFVLLLAVPLLVANDMFFPLITPKAYFFRVVVEIIFLLWIILALFYPKYRPKVGYISASIFIFMIGIFLANIFGANWSHSFWSNFERMEGYVTLLHLFAAFLVASSVVKESSHWLTYLKLFVLVNLITVFQAFAQIFEEGINYRIDTTLGNPTYLAAYVLFGAFISLFLMTRVDYSKSGRFWKSFQFWIYSVIFVLQSVVLFQTGTRGAMIGWVIGIFFVVISNVFKFNLTDRDRTESIVHKKYFISALVILIALFSTIFVFRDSAIVQNTEGLKRITSISLQEQTAQARLINWGIAFEGFKENPILGWGQNNYNLVFDRYYDPAMHGNEIWFDRTHNIVFDWLIAGGLVGLLSYALIFLAAIYVIAKSSIPKSSRAVLISMLFAYVVHNMFVFDHLVSYILFFIILSYAHSQLDSSAETVFNKINNKIESFEFPQAGRIAATALLIVLIPITVYGFNYQSYKANKEMILALRIARVQEVDGQKMNAFVHPNGISDNLDLFLSAINRDTFANEEIRQRFLLTAQSVARIDANGIEQDRARFVEEAISQMLIQAADTPEDSRYPYLLGTFMANLGNASASEEQLLNAINLSPNKQAIRIPLIRVYIHTGNSEKAISLAKETYELDTSKDELWIEYVSALSSFGESEADILIEEAIEGGEFDRVRKLLERNISFSPDEPQPRVSLAAFYNRIGNTEKAYEVIDQAIEKFPEHSAQLDQIRDQIGLD